MTTKLTRSAAALAAGALLITGLAAGASAAPPPEAPGADAPAHRPDNRPGPLTKRQEALRKAAHQKLRAGEATENDEGVTEVAEDKYVQTTLTGEAQVFTILAEFGDQGSGRLGTTPGPLHNEIEEPNRTADNSTIWIEDFSPEYYEGLFYGDGLTFDAYYRDQSQGAYGVGGAVSEWVQVPGNASTYGDNAVEDYGGAWQFIVDAADAWYAEQDPATAVAFLAQFDVWDRYDQDGDGNFDEPDGYLDHFQAVHAGEGEEAGGGAQGGDAIWSHRWYVNATDFGQTGPVVDGQQVKFGGTEIGDSGYWIGDYTVEPENGGLGVFAHEFAHDLGLPDFYDTAGGDNSTAFWTVMSGGSWMGLPGDPATSPDLYGIGDVPNNFGPWEKLQLGWLDYAVVSEGQSGDFTLSSASVQADGQEQALVVDVPDQGVTEEYTTPYLGDTAWWSGSADDLNTTLTTTLDLTGISKATVTAKAWYDIEAGYDYLYAEYSTDGTDWIQIGNPVDGSTNGRWTNLRYSVPGGGEVQFRFRYQTDGGVHYAGAFLDAITVSSGGTTLVEPDGGTWIADGWKESTGTEVFEGDRYYLAEYRTYDGYDATIQTGPYNFDKAYTAPNHVEHFPYQDGLLVWMVDEAYSDNSTSTHPGHGLALPIDARPTPILYSDGAMLGNRRQPFDATFGLQATDAVTFHREVLQGKGKNQQVVTLEAPVPSSAGIATFSDADEDAFWSSDNPWASALVAGHGVAITVTSQGDSMGVSVTNP